MKKIFFSLIFLLTCLTGYSQANYQTSIMGSLMGANDNVEIFLISNKDEFRLKVALKSTRLFMDESPRMLIKFFNNEVIDLEGKLLDDIFQRKKREHHEEEIIENTYFYSYAEFPITAMELEKFKEGVMKIRMATSPIIHNATFKKDCIGNKIYPVFYDKFHKKFDEDF